MTIKKNIINHERFGRKIENAYFCLTNIFDIYHVTIINKK